MFLEERKIKWNLAKDLTGLTGSTVCSMDWPPMRMTQQSVPGVRRTVLSKVLSSSLYLELNSFLDILEKSKFSVLDVFYSVNIDYWQTFNRNTLEKNSMILPTRTVYPADKMTFTLADLPRYRNISFIDICLDMNDKFDVALVPEDSKRKELSESKKLLIKKL